jgi:hypothetical protein
MISETKKKVLELFNEGRKNYKLMKFDVAKGLFAKALAVDPADGPSKTYLDRCKHYLENPPPEDWDGVFVMKKKM